MEPSDCNAEEADNDLEDGEIEDDDEEDIPPTEAATPQIQPPAAVPNAAPVSQPPIVPPFKDRLSPVRTERRKHEDRKKNHLTEAEKSVMFLHKLERAERERKERYKKEMAVDDFASNIEKQLAMVLRKDRSQEKDDDPSEEPTTKRGRKRKKKDKEKKKHKEMKAAIESPRRDMQDNYDDDEMMQMKGGSPERGGRNFRRERSPFYESDGGMDDPQQQQQQQHMGGMNKQQQNMRNKRMRANEGGRNRNRICLFYLQGKCQKSEDCGYSHDACLPMKLELCKFYLMDCCAKGDKCLYLHEEFPCKFYHTGLPCYEADKCKFAHGKPLTDNFKQILFKHIETAPKEILGEFPRLSREAALNMINATQKGLEAKYNPNGSAGSPKGGAPSNNSLIPSLFDINVSMPPEMPPTQQAAADGQPSGANVTAGSGPTTNATASGKPDKPGRKSRWQDCDPLEAAQAIQKIQQQQQLQQLQLQQQQQQMALGMALGGLGVWKDQDMRINSNGDVDMRAMPPIIPPPQILSSIPAPSPISPAILVPNVPPPQILSPTPQGSTIPPMNTLPPAIINPPPSTTTATAINPAAQHQILQPAAIPPQPAEIPASISDLNLQFKASSAAVAAAAVSSMSGGMNVSSSSLVASEDGADREPSLSIVEEPEEPQVAAAVQQPVPVPPAQPAAVPAVAATDDYDSDGNEHELTIDEKLDEVPLQHLPKKQRELFLRIQGLQKENMPDANEDQEEQSDKEDWYSDDEDDDNKSGATSSNAATLPAAIKSVEMMEKLGDLSKIDISAEVTKLLSSISQQTQGLQALQSVGGAAAADAAAASGSSPTSTTSSAAEPTLPSTGAAAKVIRDPRLLGAAATTSALQATAAEPTMGGEAKSSLAARVSIYEQGSISVKDQKEMEKRRKQDVDLRNLAEVPQNLDLDMRADGGGFGDTDLRQIGRSDVDLRQLNLPFKAMANYTPATEIDASIGSHSPMVYKVHLVEIPRPDYTGLKLSAQDALVSGDPRLRKIFRLSVDEKESPASPPQKPASPPKPSTRVDPRRRGKTGAGDGAADGGAPPVNPMLLQQQQLVFPMDAAMSYNQQINLIQNSAFYQSLTPSQKLLFNQEIATKVNKSANDPILSGIMSSLGLAQPGAINGSAMNILTNVGGGPMGGMPMGMPPGMPMGPVQPGLLGAAPGIPNMGGPPPPDFQINLDPRNGGLLGQAPAPFPPFPPDNPGNFQQYNDDFYPNEPPPNFGGGGNMGGGGNNNGNNNRNDRHFRDRDGNNRGGRRGRWNNRHNNNNRNYNRNRNRSNRSHSPP